MTIEKKKIKRIIKAGTITLCLLCVLYLLGCILLPPLFIKQKDSNEVLDVITVSGERVCLVDDNMYALTWRLRLIQSAKEEIILSTFDFRDDNSGRDIMAALYDAAERGVHIRILIDGFNGWLQLSGSENFETLLAHENVEGKFYNPIKVTKLWTVNYRLHDKYVLIDNDAYILGGRNTNDLFLGYYTEEYNIDRDVVVYDPSSSSESTVTVLKAYFEEIWSLDSNQVLNYSEDVSAVAFLKEHWCVLQEDYENLPIGIDWTTETIETNGVALLTADIIPSNKAPLMLNTLAGLMKSGTESVVIQTPYIICDDEMYDTLEDICDSIENIEIVVNAVENGANPWGCTDYMNEKDNILGAGVTLIEWSGKQSMHTKTILIDDSVSIIGSYNLDARSTYLDTEMMLVIDSPELNEQLRNGIENMKTQSKRIESDGMESIGFDYAAKEMTFFKNVLYFVLRIVVRPFRYLL